MSILLATSLLAMASSAAPPGPAAPAIPMPSPARSDFSNEETPNFRGWESTHFAGWRDWSGLQPNLFSADPDDPATTAPFATISTVSDSLFINASGDLCNPGNGGFSLGYGVGLARPIHEVVVQISSPDAQTMDVTMEYSAFPPDTDFVAPSESYDLSPTERVHRFLISSRGFYPGVLTDISGFVLRIDGPAQVDCLDAVLLDVRYALDGEFDSTGCPEPQLNSVGVRAGCEAAGSSLASDNLFQLTASGLPPGEFGYFIGSETFGWVPCPGCGPQGELCIQGSIARFLPAQAAAGNFSFQRSVDLSSIPLTPTVAVVAGSTWHFQAWYRDKNPTPTTNFTLPVSVQFQ